MDSKIFYQKRYNRISKYKCEFKRLLKVQKYAIAPSSNNYALTVTVFSASKVVG